MERNFIPPQHKSAHDEDLKAAASEAGLPEGATWADVNIHRDNKALKAAASEEGLPEGSTWADVNIHRNGRGR